MKSNQCDGGKLTRADIVIVGAGPATLGLLCNAMKTNRLNELVNSGDGIAILEQGLSFGGGDLVNFGINSNTSARGFLKCCFKKRDIAPQYPQHEEALSPAKNFLRKGAGADSNACSPMKRKGRDKSSYKNEEESEDELAEDSERSDGGGLCDEAQKPPQMQSEIVPLNCFKDFY